MRRLTRVSPLVLMSIVVAGCSSGPAPTPATAPSTPTAPVPVSASFIQPRIDEGSRRAAIRVTDHGSSVIEVSSVQLLWSGFAAMPPAHRDNPVQPRLTIDFPLILGAPRCHGGTNRPRARVVVDRRSVTVAIDSAGEAFLRDVWRRACATKAVDDATEITFGSRWTPAGPHASDGLRGTLVLHRRARATSIIVSSLEGTVLLDFIALTTSTPLLSLPAGRPEGRLAVVLRSNGRCDSHALSQSTQTFLLRVGVRVRSTSTQVIVIPSQAAQRRLKAMIHSACGIDNNP